VHAEPSGQPQGRGIGGLHDGDDARGAELGKAHPQAHHGRLGGISVSPKIRAQAPADLDLALYLGEPSRKAQPGEPDQPVGTP